MRDIIGDDLPLYANLGICQVEQLLGNNRADKISDLVKRLRADGLIIHVNPMQEWFQGEGDVLKYPPIDTIRKVLDVFKFPIIVKEVGQGMGWSSLFELLKLPIEAIEFGAFGGTNFAKVELLRDTTASNGLFEPFSFVGADAYRMMEDINDIYLKEKEVDFKCKQLIISGGIKSFLDGYYFVQKSPFLAVFGQASSFLKYAKEDYNQLQAYISQQIKGYEMAQAYLRVK